MLSLNKFVTLSVPFSNKIPLSRDEGMFGEVKYVSNLSNSKTIYEVPGFVVGERQKRRISCLPHVQT